MKAGIEINRKQRANNVVKLFIIKSPVNTLLKATLSSLFFAISLMPTVAIPNIEINTKH